MKNKHAMIFFVLFLISFITMAFFLTNTGKQYSREAYVELNTGKKIVFNNTWGNKWEWTIEETENKEIQSLTKGEKVILTFDVNNTYDKVEDDIIIKVSREKKKIVNKEK